MILKLKKFRILQLKKPPVKVLLQQIQKQIQQRAEEATLGTAADQDIEDTIDHETETDSSAAVVDEVCPDEIYDNETSISDHTSVVHAVATFRNSSNDAIGQDDINSLQNFICSEA